MKLIVESKRSSLHVNIFTSLKRGRFSVNYFGGRRVKSIHAQWLAVHLDVVYSRRR